MKPWVPSCAKRCTHLRKAEYVNWSVSETVCRRCPLTTSRTAWARRKTRASFVCFKKVSKVGRASSGKCSLRVRMRVVSRIKYYKNITIPPPTPCLSSSRNKAFSTQISRKLLHLQEQPVNTGVGHASCRHRHQLGRERVCRCGTRRRATHQTPGGTRQRLGSASHGRPS